MATEDSTLSYSDEQVARWLREGLRDAEIAVRLGISVGEAKEKIGRVRRRVDEETQWQRPGPGEEHQGAESEVEGGAPGEGLPEPRRYSRRAVIAAGLAGVGVTAAATAGAFALFRGSDDGTGGADTDETPDGQASTTSSPRATATAHPGVGAIRVDQNAWERAQGPNGMEIPYSHGVGFINTTTGEIDVLSLAGIPPEQAWGYGYKVSRSGRFVAGEGPIANDEFAHAGLFDRESGRSLGWDPRVLRLAHMEDRALVFAEMRADSTYGGNVVARGPVLVPSPELDSITAFDMGPSIRNGLGAVSLSEDGAILLAFNGISRSPALVDLETGALVQGEPLRDEWSVAWAEPGEGSTVRVVCWGEQPGVPVAVTYGPDGQIVSEVEGDEGSGRAGWFNRPVATSPDGRWSAVQSTLRDTSFSLGDQENWIFTELRNEPGAPQFRVMSGQLLYGLTQHRRWLADSSACIVEAGTADVEFEDYRSFRRERTYYLVDPASGDLEVLHPVPRGLHPEADDDQSGDWYYAYFGGPEPAPDNPDLFAFGGLSVFSRRTGEWFAPGNWVQPMGSDPWEGGQSRELRFTFPPGGKDWSSSGTILPPYVEEPPFREFVTLQVARAGTCVNLRDGPSDGAGVLDCLPDGARLTVVEPREPLGREGEWHEFEPGRRPAFWNNDIYEEGGDHEDYQMYVHVEAQSGARGWVAIQYLDWATT